MLGGEMKLIREDLGLGTYHWSIVLGTPNSQWIDDWEAEIVPVPTDVADRIMDIKGKVAALKDRWMSQFNQVLEKGPPGEHQIVMIQFKTLEDYLDAYPEDGMAIPHAHILHKAVTWHEYLTYLLEIAETRMRLIEHDPAALDGLDSNRVDIEFIDYDQAAFKSWADAAGRPHNQPAREDWAAFMHQERRNEVSNLITEYQIPSVMPRVKRWEKSLFDFDIIERLTSHLPKRQYAEVRVAPRHVLYRVCETEFENAIEHLDAIARKIGQCQWYRDDTGVCIPLWVDDKIPENATIKQIIHSQKSVQGRIRKTLQQFSLVGGQAESGAIMIVHFINRSIDNQSNQIHKNEWYGLKTEVFYKDSAAMTQGELTAIMSVSKLMNKTINSARLKGKRNSNQISERSLNILRKLIQQP